jgi:hypothetical protein
MPTGSVDDTFAAKLEDLAASAVNAGDAALNEDLRQWIFADDDAWDGDPLDVADISNLFDRSNLGEMYSEAFTSDDGSAGDAEAAKIQSDYLASMERAFRLRHRTPISRAMNAASRKYGQGDDSVGLFARTSSYIEDVLAAGADGFESRDSI